MAVYNVKKKRKDIDSQMKWNQTVGRGSANKCIVHHSQINSIGMTRCKITFVEAVQN